MQQKVKIQWESQMNRYKHRKKAKMNAIVMIKKKITQKTGLRRK